MAFLTIRPTRADVEIANFIAAHTDPGAEDVAKALTWGADEHLLCALALGWWLYARNKSLVQQRASTHVLVCTLVTAALPHGLKLIFDQERPDRTTVRGHWRGIPFSGKRFDAFPSGHAVHIGGLASAASVLPPRQRNLAWTVGGLLVGTRIVLLAHWTSDVIAGLLLGASVERILRRFTGYPMKSPAKKKARQTEV